MAATTAPQRTGTIRVEDLTKVYGAGETEVRALREVDFEIASGELVVLLGASGSGKTTLLNIIGAIEPATSGTVEVAGHDLAGMDHHQRTAFRRDAVGFVFQFFNLVPTLTAVENVALVAELTGPDAEDRARETLGEVGLADRLGHFPAQLSGGEQQRVAIARALVKRPPVLLTDEPTGALDLDTGRSVLRTLQRAAREQGCTVLMVTHNAVIADMADRVLRLRDGEIVGDDANAAPVDPEDLAW